MKQFITLVDAQRRYIPCMKVLSLAVDLIPRTLFTSL